MNNVYVIRWVRHRDGITESGNFEWCYLRETDAIAAMREDMKNVRKEWKTEVGKTAKVRSKTRDDYGVVWVRDGYDMNHSWFIDCLGTISGDKTDGFEND